MGQRKPSSAEYLLILCWLWVVVRYLALINLEVCLLCTRALPPGVNEYTDSMNTDVDYPFWLLPGCRTDISNAANVTLTSDAQQKTMHAHIKHAPLLICMRAKTELLHCMIQGNTQRF